MEAQKELMNNLLKERGMFNFKPFIGGNSDEQLWGYCTQNDDGEKFHLCKSSLEEVPLGEFDSSASFFVIRASEDSYSVIAEKKYISNTEDRAWLVNCEGIIVNKEFQGYQIIGDYLILSPDLEKISFEKSLAYCWKPEKKCLMFNFENYEIPQEGMMYCASTEHFHIGSVENEYFVFDNSKGSYQCADSFLVYNGIVYLIKYSIENRQLVGKNHQLIWEAYDDDGTSLFQIATGIKTDSLDDCQVEWDCSHNCFALTVLHNDSDNKSLCMASWDWECLEPSIDNNRVEPYRILCTKSIEKNVVLTRVGECAVLVGNDIFDIYGNRLAWVGKKDKYAIISKTIPDVGHLISSIEDDYKLSGVLKMDDLSVVIPMQYQEIIIQSTEPDLIVLARKDYWDGSRYELLKNGASTFPETNTSCELSKINSDNDKLILIKENGKYGIIYKGKALLPVIYDKIEGNCTDNYLIVSEGGWKFLYNIDDNFFSKRYKDIHIVFSSWNFTGENVFFLGDSSLLMIDNGEEEMINDDKLVFLCSDEDESFFIFQTESSKYVCYNDDGNMIKMKPEHDDSGDVVYYEIVGYDSYFIPYKKIVTDGPPYSINGDYHGDDYDYEEDTYYALGGTDYYKFRENGGSIDDMMDGMGY